MKFPAQIWIVVEAKRDPSGAIHPGERHVLYGETLGGIEAWMKGVDCWIAEYSFEKSLHVPAQKKPG